MHAQEDVADEVEVGAHPVPHPIPEDINMFDNVSQKTCTDLLKVAATIYLAKLSADLGFTHDILPQRKEIVRMIALHDVMVAITNSVPAADKARIVQEALKKQQEKEDEAKARSLDVNGEAEPPEVAEGRRKQQKVDRLSQQLA